MTYKKYKEREPNVVIVEAKQWFKDGDHSCVRPQCSDEDCRDNSYLCRICKLPMFSHGLISNGTDSNCWTDIICPGDWIAIGISGTEFKIFSPKIFLDTYEELEV